MVVAKFVRRADHVITLSLSRELGLPQCNDVGYSLDAHAKLSLET